MKSNNGRGGERLKIIAVASSSKKAGKSSLATHLIRELKADYGLKVSSGESHGPQTLIDDPEIISRGGTDTGAMVEAGAKRVLWVDAPPSVLAPELEKALDIFSAGGLLIIEGGSALAHLTPDFTVFIMHVPFEEFKPSAQAALQKANLVLVNRSGALADAEPGELERKILERSPHAKFVAYHDDKSLQSALAETVAMARRSLRR